MSATEITGRTKRQLEIVDKFSSANGVGTLIAATGFGKTYTSILILKRLFNKSGHGKHRRVKAQRFLNGTV